jgi:uncharacterized protein YndB with AHSA1/START domain
MIRFADSAETQAPPEEVWKLLYDPSRFPEWWAGVETVETGGDGEGDMTFYPEGYPDFPMPQQFETSRSGRSVKISCLVSDLRFEWRLEPAGNEGTLISVDVEIPEAEAKRVGTQREVVTKSLARLAELAASSG